MKKRISKLLNLCLKANYNGNEVHFAYDPSLNMIEIYTVHRNDKGNVDYKGLCRGDHLFTTLYMNESDLNMERYNEAKNELKRLGGK